MNHLNNTENKINEFLQSVGDAETNAGKQRKIVQVTCINFLDKNELRLCIKNNMERNGYAYIFHHKKQTI